MNFQRWSHEKINEQIVHAEAQVSCSVARYFEFSDLRVLVDRILIFFFHSTDIIFDSVLWPYDANARLREYSCFSIVSTILVQSAAYSIFWTDV